MAKNFSIRDLRNGRSLIAFDSERTEISMPGEKERIQEKQGGHHYRSPEEEPALDDTDRNTDKIIKPNENRRPRKNEDRSE